VWCLGPQVGGGKKRRKGLSRRPRGTTDEGKSLFSFLGRRGERWRSPFKEKRSKSKKNVRGSSYYCRGRGRKRERMRLFSLSKKKGKALERGTSEEEGKGRIAPSFPT